MTNEEAIKFFKKFRERICKDAAGYDYITCRECDFKNDCDQKEAFDLAISILSAEGDLISRKAVLDKLQEHHDFYITAYGDRLDFRDLAPKDDKARVDEITTIQAFIMELPTIPQTDGERMTNEDLIKPMQVELEADGYADGEPVFDFGKCPKCGWNFEEGDKDWEEPYCCHCGQKLKWFETEEGDTYED